MGDDFQREKDIDVDLESGENTSEEDTSNDERESKNAFRWALNGVLNLDGSEKGKYGIESCSSSSNSGVDIVGVVDEDNLELLVDNKDLEYVEHQLPYVNGNHSKQKSKAMMPNNPRKPTKPPLPPKGPSLDAGDQKFVKELAELALRKRARIKKMKAVRKMRASKSSSSSSSTYTSLTAMVITIVFFLVIILHGIRSASSAAVGLMASPESSVAADGSLISVEYPTNFPSEGNAPVSGSNYPSLPEI